MDNSAMQTTISQLSFKYPFDSAKYYPFYCLVEVAGNREGSEMADRLFDLLGASEDLIIVSSSLFIVNLGWCGGTG